MPKKSAPKKVAKKDDSDDEYEVEDDVEEQVEDELDEDEEEESDEEDEEEEDEENDGIQADENTQGCGVDELFDAIDGEGEETEVSMEQSAEYVNKENRVSNNRMTKYEMVRILGERIKQLNMGAKPLIKNHSGLSYDTIAEEEFKKNMIPFKIKRPLPNGMFEIWSLDELKKDHLMSQLNE